MLFSTLNDKIEAEPVPLFNNVINKIAGTN